MARKHLVFINCKLYSYSKISYCTVLYNVQYTCTVHTLLYVYVLKYDIQYCTLYCVVRTVSGAELYCHPVHRILYSVQYCKFTYCTYTGITTDYSTDTIGTFCTVHCTVLYCTYSTKESIDY